MNIPQLSQCDGRKGNMIISKACIFLYAYRAKYCKNHITWDINWLSHVSPLTSPCCTVTEKHSEPWHHEFCNKAAVVPHRHRQRDTSNCFTPVITSKRYTWRPCHRVMSPSPPTSRWLAGSRDLIKKSSFPTTGYEGCNTCQQLTTAGEWGGSQSYSYALLQCCQFTIQPGPIWPDSIRKACTHSTENSRRKSHSEEESDAVLKVVQKHKNRKERGRCNPFSNYEISYLFRIQNHDFNRTPHNLQCISWI
jgi:hypothetical protein